MGEPQASAIASAGQLRLLSYNIQAGIAMHSYRQYLTRSWQHLLPTPQKHNNLCQIATLMQPYDCVGLQETDTGGLRSGFVNQTQFLAAQAGFPYWHDQTNRRFGRISQHGNSLLTRLRPTSVESHSLPGPNGRGALLLRLPVAGGLTMIVVHLALSQQARQLQLAYLGDLVRGEPQVVVMGDFNCALNSPGLRNLLDQTGLQAPTANRHTFPSWRPRRSLDHILISPSLRAATVGTLSVSFSDHLPLTLTLTV